MKGVSRVYESFCPGNRINVLRCGVPDGTAGGGFHPYGYVGRRKRRLEECPGKLELLSPVHPRRPPILMMAMMDPVIRS